MDPRRCFFFIVGQNDVLRIKVESLFNRIKKLSDDQEFENLQNFIQKETNCTEDHLRFLTSKLNMFKFKLRKKWAEASRIRSNFLKKNRQWLQSFMEFKIYPIEIDQNILSKRGRPTVNFEESSDCVKRRKTISLRKCSVDMLAYATQMKLRSTGNIEASKILKEISSNPEQAKMYRDVVKKHDGKETSKITNDEALSLITEAKLSRHQYSLVRHHAKSIFPCYSHIQNAKKNCYPEKEFISVTDICAKIMLQGLLDHTTVRLLQSIKNVLESRPEISFQDLHLISKWGIDGTNASEYKQQFENANSTDGSLLFTSVVPIQLYLGENKSCFLWQNPRPSSTRYCRPIRFCFERETIDSTKAEKERVDREIQSLIPSTFSFNGQIYKIHHTLTFTMIDGKICNAITNNKSTQRCYICDLTCKDFNNIEKCLQVDIKQETFEFGLSILHAWIRFMECLLHLSYKIEIKKYQARGPQEKDIVARRKQEIQTDFKRMLSLSVDKPKQRFGNTNDGNTARRFFEHEEESARITGIDKNLIHRFHVILRTLSSGYDIDANKFKEFCQDTAKLYVEKYPWYMMPPTVHKILIHGPQIIDNALLPIGQLSEEAQEARNKDIKQYRQGHSRKCSRLDTNTDILNHLLISSDPLITSLRKLPPKTFKKFPIEVQHLLKPPKEPAPLDFSSFLANSSSESDSD